MEKEGGVDSVCVSAFFSVYLYTWCVCVWGYN